MAALDEAAIKSVYDALLTHASRTGCFSRSPIDHEPLNAPGSGMSFALTEGPMTPAPSGLAATSLRWQFLFILYYPWQEGRSQQSADIKLTAAVIAFLSSLASDLTLTDAGVADGRIREVNVLSPVSQPGWTEISGTRFRVRQVTVNIDVNDAFDQAVNDG